MSPNRMLSLGFKFLSPLAVVLLLQCFTPSLSYRTYKCDTCKNFVKNFNRGLERTARSNFGGGNTNWEEQNLGSYAGSETRFLEILESSCEEGDKDECHSMIEIYEEHLEIWWFEHHKKGNLKNLFTYFCDETLKVCCPDGTYGPKCQNCPGGRASPCNGHGNCEGSGERTGGGTCSCHAGFEGELCDECSDGYFSETDENGKPTCTACHKSCKTSCNSALATGCDDCKAGWRFISGQGCADVDECKEGLTCPHNEYCFNLEGSYKCKECHEACQGCTGPDNNQCLSCSAKHFLKESECLACHPSCNSSCSGGSALDCDACAEGWILNAETNMCIDKDECEDGSHGCSTENQYCSNIPGSFQCLACHEMCTRCTGPDQNQCLACKGGFRLVDGSCIDVNECDGEGATCTGENEQCINTVGSFRCDCIKGHVRRMGSPCFKKNIVMKKTKSKPNGNVKPRPSMDEFNIVPGPDGFQKEDIEKLGDPLEPEEEMISMGGDTQQDKEEL